MAELDTDKWKAESVQYAGTVHSATDGNDQRQYEQLTIDSGPQ
jgi:hypothetical protein